MASVFSSLQDKVKDLFDGKDNSSSGKPKKNQGFEERKKADLSAIQAKNNVVTGKNRQPVLKPTRSLPPKIQPKTYNTFGSMLSDMGKATINTMTGRPNVPRLVNDMKKGIDRNARVVERKDPEFKGVSPTDFIDPSRFADNKHADSTFMNTIKAANAKVGEIALGGKPNISQVISDVNKGIDNLPFQYDDSKLPFNVTARVPKPKNVDTDKVGGLEALSERKHSPAVHAATNIDRESLQTLDKNSLPEFLQTKINKYENAYNKALANNDIQEAAEIREMQNRIRQPFGYSDSDAGSIQLAPTIAASDVDKSLMTTRDVKKIEDYRKKYMGKQAELREAQKSGNEDRIAEAYEALNDIHAEAERIRNFYGYSGGQGGMEYRQDKEQASDFKEYAQNDAPLVKQARAIKTNPILADEYMSMGVDIDDFLAMAEATEDERLQYNYLYNKYGNLFNRFHNEANDYFANVIKRKYNERIATAEEAWQDEADIRTENKGTVGDKTARGLVATLGPALINPTAGTMSYAGNIADKVFHGDIDENAPFNRLQSQAMQQRQKFSDSIEDPILKFAYNTAAASVDSLAVAAFGPVGLVAMSTGAANNALIDDLKAGKDEGKAILHSFIVGGMEFVTERIPLKRLSKTLKLSKGARKTAIKDVKSLAKETSKQMGLEASGEAVAEISQTIADDIIFDEQSDRNRYKRQLIEEGMSEDRAEEKATEKFYIENTAYAAAIGAASGGATFGSVAGINKVTEGKSISKDTPLVNTLTSRGKELKDEKGKALAEKISKADKPDIIDLANLKGYIQEESYSEIKNKERQQELSEYANAKPAKRPEHRLAVALWESSDKDVEYFSKRDFSLSWAKRSSEMLDTAEEYTNLSPIERGSETGQFMAKQLKEYIDNASPLYFSYALEPNVSSATKNAMELINQSLSSEVIQIENTDNLQGKQQGNSITYHISTAQENENISNTIKEANKIAKTHFVKYDIAKFNPTDLTVEYIKTEDFDNQSEPVVTSKAIVDLKTNEVRYQNPNPNEIIVDKADYVPDDYSGFDVQAAKERYEKWHNRELNGGIGFSPNRVNDSEYFNEKFGSILEDVREEQSVRDNPNIDNEEKEDATKNKVIESAKADSKGKAKKIYDSEGKRVFIDRDGDEIVFDNINPSKDIFQLFKDENVKKLLSNMNPVATLTGEELKKSNKEGDDLVSQVTEYFNTIDNKVERDDLGTIRLIEEGIRSSIAHGLGRIKAIAFKAVPDVIEKGKIIAGTTNYKGRKYDNILIAAPIKIGKDKTGSIYNVIVVVNNDGRFNDFYLHEANKTNDVSPRLEPQPLKAEGEPSSDTSFITNSITDDEASRQPVNTKNFSTPNTENEPTESPQTKENKEEVLKSAENDKVADTDSEILSLRSGTTQPSKTAKKAEKNVNKMAQPVESEKNVSEEGKGELNRGAFVNFDSVTTRDKTSQAKKYEISGKVKKFIGKDVESKGISGIIRGIEKVFAVSIFTKGITARDKALGVYDNLRQHIALKMPNDLTTALHELGHHLDRQLNLNELPGISNMLNNTPGLKETMSKMGYSESDMKKEVVADFVRMYMTNPDVAYEYGKYAIDGEVNENFYNTFENVLSANKKLIDVQGTRKCVLDYASLDTVKKSLSTIKTRKETKMALNFDQARRALYVACVSKNAGLEWLDKALDKAAQQNGKKITPKQKLALLAATADSANGITAKIIEPTKSGGVYMKPDQTLDYERGTLTDIVRDLKGFKNVKTGKKLKDKELREQFDNYLKMRHAEDWAKQGKYVYSPDTLIPEEIPNALAQIESTYKKTYYNNDTGKTETITFKDLSDRIYKWWNGFMQDWMVDTGFLSEETYTNLQELNPHYVPNYRQLDEVNSESKAIGTSAKSLMQRSNRQGSTRDTYSPTENLILKANQIVTGILKNDTMRMIHELYHSNDEEIAAIMGQYFQEVPQKIQVVTMDMTEVKDRLKKAISKGKLGSDIENTSIIDDLISETTSLVLPREYQNDDIVSINVNGEYHHYYIKTDDGMGLGKSLVKAFQTQSRGELKGVVNIMRATTRAFSAVTTSSNPLFTISNAVRDFQHGWAFIKPNRSWDIFNLQFVTDYAITFAQGIGIRTPRIREKMSKLQPLYDLYEANNAHITKYMPGQDTLKKTLRSIQRKRNPIRWSNFTRLIEEMNAIVEQTPRMIALKRAYYSTEGTHKDKAIAAIAASREATVNFYRRGRATSSLAACVPFIGAAMAGIDQIGRTFNPVALKNDKAARGIALRALIQQAIPATIIALALGGGDDETSKEYNRFSSYMQQNFWLFKAGDVWIRLPKDREISAMFGTSFQWMLQYFVNPDYEDDPDYIKNYFLYFKDQFLPPYEFTGIALFNALNNKTWRGGKILSASDEQIIKAAEGHGGESNVDLYKEVRNEDTSDIAVAIANAIAHADVFNVVPSILKTPKGQHYILDQSFGGIADILLPLTAPSGEGLKSALLSKYTANPNKQNKYIAELFAIEETLSSREGVAKKAAKKKDESMGGEGGEDDSFYKPHTWAKTIRDTIYSPNSSKRPTDGSVTISDLYEQKKENQRLYSNDKEKMHRLNAAIDMKIARMAERTVRAYRNSPNQEYDGEAPVASYADFVMPESLQDLNVSQEDYKKWENDRNRFASEAGKNAAIALADNMTLPVYSLYTKSKSNSEENIERKFNLFQELKATNLTADEYMSAIENTKQVYSDSDSDPSPKSLSYRIGFMFDDSLTVEQQDLMFQMSDDRSTNPARRAKAARALKDAGLTQESIYDFERQIGDSPKKVEVMNLATELGWTSYQKYLYWHAWRHPSKKNGYK